MPTRSRIVGLVLAPVFDGALGSTPVHCQTYAERSLRLAVPFAPRRVDGRAWPYRGPEAGRAHTRILNTLAMDVAVGTSAEYRAFSSLSSPDGFR